MSGGFSFPPPPPPPPKGAPTFSEFAASRQYGSTQRGGGRGRGRGRYQGSGRGGGNLQGHGNFQSRAQYNGPGSFQQPPMMLGQNGYGTTQPMSGWPSSPQIHHEPSLPAGAFVNPAFASTTPNANTFNMNNFNPNNLIPSNIHQISINPTNFNPSLVYPNSFHPNISNVHQQDPAYLNNSFPHNIHTSYSQPGSSGSSSPPPPFAGQKRKREFPGYPQRGPQRPKVQVAPAVPSFGPPIPLPPKPEASSAANGQTGGKRNGLGLTPSSELVNYDDSEDDQDEEDVGEEFLMADLEGKLMFEHNGAVSTLKTPAEIKSWIEERRKRWPTQSRIKEKHEESKKRGEERKRLISEGAALRNPHGEQDGESNRRKDGRSNGRERQDRKERKEKRPGAKGRPSSVNGKSELEATKRALADQTRKLEKLQRQLALKEAAKVQNQASDGCAEDGCSTAAAVKDEQDEAFVVAQPDSKPSTTANLDNPPEATSQAHASTAYDLSDPILKVDVETRNATAGGASVDFPDISSDSSSEVSSDSNSDSDPPPEEASSKQAPAPISQQKPCFSFVRSGYCRSGHRCRYKHELPARGSAANMPPPTLSRPQHKPAASANEPRTKRLTLYQRLVEQEKDDDDRLALQVVKHLGSVGYFRAAPPPEAFEEGSQSKCEPGNGKKSSTDVNSGPADAVKTEPNTNPVMVFDQNAEPTVSKEGDESVLHSTITEQGLEKAVDALIKPMAGEDVDLNASMKVENAGEEKVSGPMNLEIFQSGVAGGEAADESAIDVNLPAPSKVELAGNETAHQSGKRRA